MFYFWIYRELQAIDSKESQIFYNRQRNRYNRGTGEELKNSEHDAQIYLKTAIFKTRNGESGNGNGEWESAGNDRGMGIFGESAGNDRGIFGE